MISDVEHFSICVGLLCRSSLEECLFRPFAYFLIGLFVFLVLSCASSLYMLEIKPLPDVSLVKVFSHTVSEFPICLADGFISCSEVF